MIQGVQAQVLFLSTNCKMRPSESYSARLNSAIYAAFVSTPTEIMAQLNNLAVACK